MRKVLASATIMLLLAGGSAYTATAHDDAAQGGRQEKATVSGKIGLDDGRKTSTGPYNPPRPGAVRIRLVAGF
jgi:hypothetical protein